MFLFLPLHSIPSFTRHCKNHPFLPLCQYDPVILSVAVRVFNNTQAYRVVLILVIAFLFYKIAIYRQSYCQSVIISTIANLSFAQTTRQRIAAPPLFVESTAICQYLLFSLSFLKIYNMKQVIKPVLLCLSASMLVLFASAQIFDKTRGKNVQLLLNQKTYVYSFGKGAYTDRMTAAFNSYWKITPFEVKDISTGLPALEEDASVFGPTVVGLTVRDHATSMNNPFYVFGQAGTSGQFNGEGIVAAFPINGFHYEFDVRADNMYSRSLLRLPYMVYNLHDMLTYLKTNGDEKGYYKTIDAKNGRIAGKTLLIPSDLVTEWDVNPNTTALMKGKLEAGQKDMKPIMAAVLDEGDISFGGKYKVMKTEDIIKLEQGPDADKYTLFLPAIDNKKYIMVYDLKTKELLYYEHVNMGMRIKGKDFDKLNKAVGL
jgi:hypothetical protein